MSVKKDPLLLTEYYREQAQHYYLSDDIEVHGDAEVMIGDDGGWVQAWVFIPAEEEE